MDQTTELAKVKARIRALAARTVDRGCSEAEAMAAAAKVGELLEVYGLSMSEVELREEACRERRMPCPGPQRVALRWLFPALLRFCECRGWTDGRQDFVLFGLEPDVQMAEWLLGVLGRALATEEARYRAGPDYAARRLPPQAVLRSFRYGFAERVAKRLDALADERAAALAAKRAAAVGASASRALVLAKERKVEAAFAELGVKLRTISRSATVRDGGAFRHGAAAGSRVGLNRPVGAAPGARLPRR
ncbi:MAG TPA: DUF2786 domain-containing protein [Crenalkalicoccus sp.]|nr:DUF2786 domain-containing protein [Crenalkalicoccus sp.]